MPRQQELELLAEWLGVAAQAVNYDRNTGVLTWRAKTEGKDSTRWNARYAGKECGTINDNGYRRILFRNKGKIFRISSHRLAWFILYGKLPNGLIDHINQNKLDNRPSNLRDVTNSENMRNIKLPVNNKSGLIGVSWSNKRKKWAAQASVDNRHYHLGYFADIDKANEIVKSFRRKHGFTENHGVTQ